MLLDFINGQTGVILRVKMRLASTGLGMTGISSTSSGLIISTIADTESTPTAYTQAGGTIEAVTTLGTFATPTATKCRLKKIDDTNHPGVVEIQIDSTRYAVNGAKSLIVSWSGVPGLADGDCLIPLRAVNPYDGAAFGLTTIAAINTTVAALLTATGYNNRGTITVGGTTSLTVTGLKVESIANLGTFRCMVVSPSLAAGVAGMDILSAALSGSDVVLTFASPGFATAIPAGDYVYLQS